MATGLWNSLEVLADTHPPAAVLAEWRQLAGADFPALNRFLSPTQRRAQNYPCLGERDCGCRHEVDPAELYSICQCESGGCDAVKLTPEEIVIHELDAPRFGDAVGGALGFEAADGAGVTTAAPKVWPAGIHADTRSPVFLSLCPGENELLKNLESVAAVCGEPFIVLAPTARVRSATVSAFLQREHCAFIPLASCLAPNKGGFRVTGSIRPILERFASELVATVASPRANSAAVATPRASGTKSGKKSKTPDVPVRGSEGRLSWDNDFKEIRFGGVLHNLETRKRARFCIKYLAAWKAYDEFSARHLEKQIEPYVRAQAGMDPLPESSKYNLRIQQYFHGNKNLQKLGSELIVLAGNGRYYLRTQ